MFQTATQFSLFHDFRWFSLRFQVNSSQRLKLVQGGAPKRYLCGFMLPTLSRQQFMLLETNLHYPYANHGAGI